MVVQADSRYMHRRTLAAAMLIASVSVLGFLGLSCVRADSARTDLPTINVIATLPGRSAEAVASSIATPLEQEFSKISGVKSLTSSSRQGETSIILQFDPSRGIDAASRDVQDAITQAKSKLPLEIALSFTRRDPDDVPILYLVLTSTTLPLSQVDEYAESQVARRIQMQVHVGGVPVYGAQRYALRIRLNPDALAAHGLALDQVEAGLRADKQLRPTKAADHKQRMIANRNGVHIRLGDVADLVDAVEDEQAWAMHNDRRAVILGVQRTPGSNAVEVAAAIRKLLPDFREKIPQSISIDIVENLAETDSVLGFIEAAEGTSFPEMTRYQMQATDLVRHDPAVESSISTVNGDKGRLFLHLKPLQERRRGVDEIIDELRARLAQFPGFRAHFRKPGAGRLRYILTSADFGALAEWTPKVEEKLRALRDVRDVGDDFHPGFGLTVKVDRGKARASGVPEARIETALSIFYGNHRVSNEPAVILELQPGWLGRPDALSKVYVSSDGDKLAPLGTLATLDRGDRLAVVNHTGSLPSVTISFDLRPGANIDKAIAEIRLPSTVKGSFVRN
jgi:multidrug efflux pump subunit AcrB